MKKIIYTSIFILAFNSLYSQQLYLNEDKIITGDETVNGWIFNVCEDSDFAKEDFKDFIKDKYDLKAKKKNKYTAIVEEAHIPNVSTKRGDLMIYYQHSDTGNIMGISYLLGYDISLNSKDNPTEMTHLKELSIDFMEYHYNSYYGEQIDDLQKQLASAKKDLHNKESDISSMKKKEMNYDKKLSKEDNEEKKIELENDLDELTAEIEETYDLLPALKEQIETLQTSLDKEKKELLTLQEQIKELNK